ncbi:hypothetical protein FA13DRAFT_756719 [Coprinellus micaceus]|uniref:Uncharacterized protein n=1 Tax=Coprinellus micaceus TaxID=71717 RepID=A0A4Y7T5B3_COPMI|nr:hypothetical protein FA13DRAFT_756719 [Coprinellus micaceus]
MSEQPQSSNPNGPHPSTQGEPVADPNEVIGQSPPSRVFKITVWRAMNSIVIMGFGTTKAVLAFRDNPSADAFDVALGLIWALIAYWCGIIEAECPGVAPWLFEVDMKEPLVDVGKALLEENVFMILLFVAVGIGETSDSLPLDVPSPGVLL